MKCDVVLTFNTLDPGPSGDDELHELGKALAEGRGVLVHIAGVTDVECVVREIGRVREPNGRTRDTVVTTRVRLEGAGPVCIES